MIGDLVKATNLQPLVNVLSVEVNCGGSNVHHE